MTWDTSVPQDSDFISLGAGVIRTLKTDLQTSLRGNAADGTEAKFPGSDTANPIYRYRGLKGTTGARPAAGQYGLYCNTTLNTIQRDNGTSWDDVATLIPSGTKMLFFQASVPTGWTIDATHNAKVLRVVSATGGGSGGTDDPATTITLAHTHTVDSHTHTLTTSSNGAHTHTVAGHTHTIGSDGGHTHTVDGHTHSIGSDGGHTHTVAGHTHTIGSDGGHSHTVNGHTHTISASGTHTHSTPAHTHELDDVASGASFNATASTGVAVLAQTGSTAANMYSSVPAGSTSHRAMKTNTVSGGSGTSGAGGDHNHTGASGSASPGSDVQGAHTHTGATGSAGPATDSQGAHTHTGATGSTGPATDSQGAHTHTGFTGSSGPATDSQGAHTHTATTAGTAPGTDSQLTNVSLAYINVIIGTKD